MRFQYSLQKVLDLKSSEKNQAEWLLSEAMTKLHNKQKELELVVSEHEKQRQLLESSAGNGSTIYEIVELQNYIDHLEMEINRIYSEVELATSHVQQSQQNLYGKMLDEKVWNKAKEKAFFKFKANMARKEQIELDEMATLRYKMSEI